MPAARRQSDRRETARAAMIDAAISLLAEGGYSNMRLADVGRASGYSHGLAPFYFGTKAGLMLAVMDEIDRVALEYHEKAVAGAGTGREFLERWVEASFQFKDDHPLHLRASLVVLVESVTVVPEVASAYRGRATRNVDLLRDAFARGIADGSITGTVDPAVAARILTSAMRGLNYDWFANPESSPRDGYDTVRALLDLLWGSGPPAVTPRRRTRKPSGGRTGA